jgi:peptide/nickel transport system permease protein
VLVYVLRRLLALIPTWVVIGVLAFLVINLAPGDPTATLMGTESVENVALLRERLGLDRPLMERLGMWVLGTLRGDLGDSYFLGRSVVQAIGERLPVTLSLAFWSMMMSMAIGVPLGLMASVRPNGLRDTAVMGFSLLGLSIPEFFLGLILMLVFAVSLRVLPVGEYRPLTAGLIPWLRHLVLPAFSLGLIWAAYVARITRSSMLEVLNQEYILTARAKGLRESQVVWKHAFRNAILPVVTVLGMIFALLLSGAFITEYLFREPAA